MKPDLPVTSADFFAAAELHGFDVVPNISAQRLTVVAVKNEGPILCFFAPDLRTLPDGTQINGSIGVALPSGETLFLHILNLPEFLAIGRVVASEADWEPFFGVLRRALDALPRNPDTLAEALGDPTTWMGRQVAWGDAPAIGFQQRVRELNGS